MLTSRNNNNDPSKGPATRPSRPPRVMSCDSTDSEWGPDSPSRSQDSDVFDGFGSHRPSDGAAAVLPRGAGLPRTTPQGRRRIWSEGGVDRANRSRERNDRSSESTAYTSSLSSSYGSRGFSVSQWVEASDNVFDATVVNDADQTVLEEVDGRRKSSSDKSHLYPPSRQSTFSTGSSVPEELATTLTQDQLSKSLDEKHPPPRERTLSNAELLQIASSISPAVARKREQFRRGESWNASSIDSEMSVKSVASVGDLLDVVNDPEEFLLSLGFGLSTADPLDRIPKRFLSQESAAMGITVDKYLEQVRERERGYDFCLTGGLRGLERFLNTQLVNSGFDLSPSDSPGFSSPQLEGLNPSQIPPQPSRFSNGHYDFGGRQVYQPLAVNPSNTELPYNRARYLSKQSSKESSLSMYSELGSFDSEFSTSGDWSDSSFDSSRGKGKVKRLSVLESGLDTVQEELESQLRAKSPCPPAMESGSLHTPPLITRSPQSGETSADQEPVGEDLIKSGAEQEVHATSIGLTETQPADAASLKKKHFGALDGAAQDSFEIEEISNNEEQQIQIGRDERGALTRNESLQSDSSGFADEGTESVSPASPQHDRSGDDLPDDLPEDPQAKSRSQTAEYAEPNNNLDVDQTIVASPTKDGGSREGARLGRDKNGEHEQESSSARAKRGWARGRAGTFPSMYETTPVSSGPSSVIEILETLQKNYRKAEREVEAIKSGEKRRRILSKMDTIDPEEYSLSASRVRDRAGGGIVGSKGGGGNAGMGEKVIPETLGCLEEEGLGATSDKVDIQRGHGAEEDGLGTDTNSGKPEHLSGDLTLENSTSDQDKTATATDDVFDVEGVFANDPTKASGKPGGDGSIRMTSTPTRDTGGTEDKPEEKDADAPDILERLDSEDNCDRLTRGAESRGGESEEIVDRELGGTPDSSEAREIEAQRELQDLKLMQRALVKYKQELWELDEWSGQIEYGPTEAAVVGSEHIKKELDSLKSLRHRVKREVEKMEATLEDQMKEIIARRGAMDQLSRRFAHWSYSHIDVLNKMVSLMKEQESLRMHLAEIRAEEGKSSKGGDPPVSPAIASRSIYKTLTKNDLIQELVNTQLELARLRVMSRTEMTAAIVEMKKCIVSDIRREVDKEVRLMQWQIRDRDEQIEQLKMLLGKQKDNINLDSLEGSIGPAANPPDAQTQQLDDQTTSPGIRVTGDERLPERFAGSPENTATAMKERDT